MTGRDQPTLRGYPDPASVRAGDVLRLRVATAAPRFHVGVQRFGPATPAVYVFGPYDGHELPEGRADAAWDWPAYDLDLPAGWRPGVYLAALHPCKGGDHDGCVPGPVAVDRRDARVLFVVRRPDDTPAAPLLYKVPLFTYHAYNATGGSSLYVRPSVDSASGRSRVTVLRPGGGTGGDLSFPAAVDVYDPATPREGAAHWDLPFLSWLERSGYAVDVCTDLDLHLDPQVLAGHRALVVAGHDEYWSAAMRDTVEAFVGGGGSVAFFSGNTCFWQVEVDPTGSVLSCAHPPQADGDCDQWWRSRPETALTGVSYRHGGGWWAGPRDPVGFVVSGAAHWVWQGAGVRDGDVVGAQQRLVGYECDGLPLSEQSGPARPAPGAGPAGGFTVLGSAALGPGWQDRPDGPAATAVLGVHAPGGLVFTASTTDWPRVLAAGEPVVEQVTRNVLDRIACASVRVHAPASVLAGTAVTVWADLPVGVGPVRWAASTGSVAGDGPGATWTPAASGPATIWVEVDGWFGTVATEVLARRDAAQIALLEAVRALVQATPPDPVPTVPDRAGNRLLTDARWEPLTDGLRRALADDEVRALAAAAEEVLTRCQGVLASDEETQ